MGYRPAWRLPLNRRGTKNPVQSEAFKKARVTQIQSHPKCQAIARSTGKRCGNPAMIGAEYCHMHGGRFKAERAEAERMGRPIVRLRRKRQRMLGTLGSGPWPEGLPKKDAFLQLGPKARGVLFEAWFNRELDPAAWKYELTRERARR